MFSATMPQGIEDLVMAVLRDPVRVTVGTSGAGKCPCTTLSLNSQFLTQLADAALQPVQAQKTSSSACYLLGVRRASYWPFGSLCRR